MTGLTTADLITEVKLRGNIPDTTDTDSVNHDNNILRLATSIIWSRLVPAIMSIREDFYTTKAEYTIEADDARYRIPARAIGGVLRDVRLICGDAERSLPIIPQERRSHTGSGTVEGYYLENDEIVLYPKPATGGDTLVVSYFLRPNRLIATTSCSQVTALGPVTTSGISDGSYTKDFVSALAPFEQFGVDTIITVATNVVTGAPSDVTVGDWIAPQGYSPIPNVPVEFFPILATMTAEVVLRSMGNIQAAADLRNEGTQDLAALLDMLSPRTQGELPKINNTDWGITSSWPIISR